MSVAIVFKGKFVFESPEFLKSAIAALDSELISANEFVIEGTSAAIDWQGSAPYDFYGDTLPQIEAMAEQAIGGAICCKLNGDAGWIYATKPLGFAPGFDAILRDVISEDWNGVESGRDGYKDAFAADAVAAYQTVLTNWHQKSALIQLVQDSLDSALNPIMTDFLRAPPEPSHDLIWMSKAAAFSHLAGNHNLFGDLLDFGHDAVEAKAAAFVKEKL